MDQNFKDYVTYSPFFACNDSEDSSSRMAFLSLFPNLPKSLKLLLSSQATANFMISLGKRYRLEDKYVEVLSYIIRNVVMGNIFIKDFAQTLTVLNLDTQTSQTIVANIIEALFTPAIEDIRRIQQENFPDRVKQGSSNVMPPAPSNTNNTPPVNQSNVIDLRNQS